MSNKQKSIPGPIDVVEGNDRGSPIAAIRARYPSERPDPRTCRCGTVVDPVEMVGWRGSPSVWHIEDDCRACRDRKRQEADAARREAEAMGHLIRARVPERLRGYRFDASARPLPGDTWEVFRERCRSSRLIGLTRDNLAITETLQEWAPQTGSVYLCGTVGTGKTTMAAALAWRCAQLGAGPMYLPESALWSKLEDGGYHDRAAKRAWVLWLDDLGATEAPKDWQREMMEGIICERYAACSPTIFTSNCSLAEAESKWGARVGSRLVEMTAGRVYEMVGRDWRR